MQKILLHKNKIHIFSRLLFASKNDLEKHKQTLLSEHSECKKRISRQAWRTDLENSLPFL